MSRKATAVAAAASTLLLAMTALAQAQPASSDGTRPRAAGSVATAPLAGFRILLSNDDSMQMARPNASDGKGLYEVRRALCAAGADVVVIAPWANQSGAGTGSTSGGQLTVERRTALPPGYAHDCSGAPAEGAVYGVCKGASPCGPASQSATPADTVRLALGGGLAAKTGWTDGPGLVVSGANYGQNVASVVNDSGTVGAALAAIEEGVPAVALSSSYDPTVTTSLEVADRTYRETGEFAADFIGQLRRRDLLRPDFVVNVNYPYLPQGQRPRGTAWTSVGTQKLVKSVYAGSGNTFTIGSALCDPATEGCRPETKRDADFATLQRGYVTVTPVGPDRTYTGVRDARLAAYVRTHR
ncbi:5'/3'-nucleotidase SurE [Streptomyces beijiangensis]|uniref:5'-nucleotidase n=1 Tax=Streptomyces beijiangensis TaxID=163361 RepID=A0A939FBW0_9ACTN|nr:5'/3'-nucleotidase SurE [Streptomyces beijiangensis]MBO0515429.1 5'/3'-nucleotidase SurE [Streptomyces beijiangensis]